MIPIEYLAEMGAYTVENIHGVEKVKVHLVDNRTIAEERIEEFKKSILEAGVKVVGVDVKAITYYIKTRQQVRNIIVLCAASKCLAIYLSDAPTSLMSFLNDCRICFVRSNDLRVPNLGSFGVGVGELAARALKKPTLMTNDLMDIAKEVGVQYASDKRWDYLQVNDNIPSVLSENQVKLLVSDAVAYYKVGYKIISSLSSLTVLMTQHMKR